MTDKMFELFEADWKKAYEYEELGNLLRRAALSVNDRADADRLSILAQNAYDAARRVREAISRIEDDPGGAVFDTP